MRRTSSCSSEPVQELQPSLSLFIVIRGRLEYLGDSLRLEVLRSLGYFNAALLRGRLLQVVFAPRL